MNYSNACLQKVQFKLLQVSIHINNWRIIPHAPYHHVTLYVLLQFKLDLLDHPKNKQSDYSF